MLKPNIPSTIFKLNMASWQVPRKRSQLITNAVIVIALLFLAYYSISGSIPKTSSPLLDNPRHSKEVPTAHKAPSILDPTKVAFLVETRPLPHLPSLYAHMTSIIPPEWSFKLMGSTALVSLMRASPIISRLEKSGKLEFLAIPGNYSLENRETISQMFTDIHLYRDILSPAKNLLVFQPDGIFCANAPRTLNDYLQYDWVGAPWSKTSDHGGNGGLSLRNVSRIIQVLEREKRKVGDGALEDLWLTERLNRLPDAHMANATISKSFSVESVWDDTPLGYHIGWLGVHHEQIWDDQKQVDHVLEYCPEVKIILDMKLAGDKPKSVKNH